MKKKFLIITYIILLLLMIEMLYRIISNNILISKYEENEFNETIAEELTLINFQESYIAYYNYGNILFQNQKYDEAIEQYQKALECNVPEYKECNIRINYALAICQTVEVDEESQESINNAIQLYESAIDVLVEDGCANENDNNGHSKTAEQLKSDIQDEIDRLKDLLDKMDETNSNEEDENQTEENSQMSEDEETIEEQIQEIKESATESQRETESQYETYNKTINHQDKNW